MLLNSDYISPVELTGYARAALQDMAVNQFTLSRFLPDQVIDDLDYRFTRGGEGLVDAATFRAYDAESPIGARPGLSRVAGELPPISRKIRLGEYDRLRQRSANGTAVTDAILADSVRMSRAVAARVEMARGEALYTGKVTINENGVIATVDFGRAVGHTVTAGTLWSTVATATPVTNLNTWIATYIDANGERPGRILTSTRVFGLLQQNAEFRTLTASVAGTPALVSEGMVSTIFQTYGLPPIEVYDARVRVNGTSTRIIPDNRIIMLPATSEDLGATLWGTTAESLEPEFGLTGDGPGLVAGAYSTKDPVAVWTKAAAIALPVLANPDLTFAATVAT